ncbi:transcriptional repressor LexA [uncultured Clostridium sp.]|uniref:transcriptional repressor LexA n=1 Tax=uncultured Clostridium sp. TaxID=59620 RepID=UPI0025E0A02A|nr:transcriptional repressor LexA [uncultured Clostridium sp.]
MEFSQAQKRIIKSRPNGIKIIKGESGCGKTYVAVNRAFSLAQSYCVEKNDNILIISKNENSLRSIAHIYKKTAEKTIIQKSFFDEDNKSRIAINDINSIIDSYFSSYKKLHKAHYEIADYKKCEDVIMAALKNIKQEESKKYRNIRFLNSDYLQFFMDEIRWIKECGFTAEEDYFQADRSSRHNIYYGKDENIIRMKKNSRARECVFQVMKEYDKIMKKQNLVDAGDSALYAAVQCRKNNNQKYTHIIVDNIEEFSRTELAIIDMLYNEKNYSSMTFVLNTDKLEEAGGWINKKRKFSQLGYNVRGKSVTLKENFAYTINQETEDNSENNGIGKLYDEEKIEYENRKCTRRKSKAKADKESIYYPYSLLSFDFTDIYSHYTDDKKNNESDYIQNNGNGENEMEFESVKYIDLSRNVYHEFICDFYESGDIYTSDDNFKEKAENVVNIPVFNEIAAGSPILMNDEIEYTCKMPREWVRSSKDLFILKIKGDSMVKKNINDGDHVVINKSKYPSANDVVAVEIDGEATLKTFKTKGKQVILKPENDKYEPIVLKGDVPFSILGVAVGILKNFA